LVAKDGTRKLLSANIAPIKSGLDEISGAVGVFRDITRLKKIEDELRDERNNLRSIFQYAPIGLIIVDKNSIIMDVNNAFLKIIDKDIEHVNGKPFGEGISCEGSITGGCKNGFKCSACSLKNAISTVMETSEPVSDCNVIYNIYNNGVFVRHHFKVSAVPIKISNVNCAMLVIEDITNQKKIENELKANERKYRNLFMNMLNGFSYNKLIMDPEKKPIDYLILEANDEFCRMVGMPKEYVVGKRASEVFGTFGDFEINMLEEYSKVALGGEVIRFEQQMSGNEDKWISSLVYSNEKEYFALICSDISEEKRAQREMRKAMEVTNSAYKAKSEFLANMSHEIRTPLNGVVGMVDLTLTTELTPMQKDNLKTAKACADSLLRIINDVLDFSKLEAGKMVVEKIKVDLKTICDNITKSHALIAREKGLNLNYNIDKAVPNQLIGDPNRLSQVLNNLVNNALKFTEKGGVYLNISLANRNNNSVRVLFVIKDTGIGISKDDMNKLFKSFTQVDGSHTRKYGGTGLGLVISKELLNLMGSTIEVKSEKGLGSTFSFVLEFGIGQGNFAQYAEDNKIYKSEYRAHILVAEDDKINQIVICRMLDERGYTYDVVDNGIEAVQKVMDKDFDLCIMDIQMPQMDGIQATKLIRESKKKSGKYLPIIALTAHALHGDRERFLSLGMDEYLPKPIIMNEFFKKIESLIDPSKVQKENINEDNINEIEAGGCDEPLDNFELIRRKSDELGKAMMAKDINHIESCAHEIKLLAVELGIDPLKTLMFRIELAARREDINEALILNNELANLLKIKGFKY
jgi:PAS domain S-box-containing protein